MQILDCLVSYFGLDEAERPTYQRYFHYHIIAGPGPTAGSGVASITTLAIYDKVERCTSCPNFHVVGSGGPAAARQGDPVSRRLPRRRPLAESPKRCPRPRRRAASSERSPDTPYPHPCISVPGQLDSDEVRLELVPGIAVEPLPGFTLPSRNSLLNLSFFPAISSCKLRAPLVN